MKQTVFAVAIGGISAFDIPLTRIPAPSSYPDHLRLESTRNVTISPFANYVFSGPLYLGTPLQGSASQPYIYSTTSSATSIISSTTSGALVSGGYDPANSSTANNTGVSATESNYFYTGSGTYYTDQACWALNNAAACTNSTFQFDVLSTVSNNNGDSSTDGTYGILGLGYDNSTTTSFIQNLFAQNPTTAKTLSFSLSTSD